MARSCSTSTSSARSISRSSHEPSGNASIALEADAGLRRRAGDLRRGGGGQQRRDAGGDGVRCFGPERVARTFGEVAAALDRGIAAESALVPGRRQEAQAAGRRLVQTTTVGAALATVLGLLIAWMMSQGIARRLAAAA